MVETRAKAQVKVWLYAFYKAAWDAEWTNAGLYDESALTGSDLNTWNGRAKGLASAEKAEKQTAQTAAAQALAGAER